MRAGELEQGLLRALAFHEALGYAPTEVELIASWDRGLSLTEDCPPWKEVQMTLREFLKEGSVVLLRGRVVFPGQEELVFEHERREGFFPRKIRRARRVARWLARIGGVRFVALCNTTGLAHARDESDLDFFIITRSGVLWQTRGLAALPFKVLGLRPDIPSQGERDAVCLSFLIDDTALDLTSLQLSSDDPYFHHWFLSLLPLVDDGVGEVLWKMNSSITQRHPLASRWMLHPELSIDISLIRFPVLPWLETLARDSQQRVLPMTIQQQANRSTDVVINDHILKLHAVDNRYRFRERYRVLCNQHGIEP